MWADCGAFHWIGWEFGWLPDSVMITWTGRWPPVWREPSREQRGRSDLHLDSLLWRHRLIDQPFSKYFRMGILFCDLTQQGQEGFLGRECWRKSTTSMLNSRPHLAAGGGDFSSVSGLQHCISSSLPSSDVLFLTDLLHWSSHTVHLRLSSIQAILLQNLQLTIMISKLMKKRTRMNWETILH